MKMLVAKSQPKNFVRFSISTMLVVLLSACGSTPVKQTQTSQNNAPKVVEQVVYTSDDYLLMARQSGDSPTYLLKAAQTAEQEQLFEKSLIIINSLKSQSVPLEIRQQMALLEARSLMTNGDFDGAEKILNGKMAQLADIRYEVHYLKALLYGRQKRFVESLRHLFEVEKAIENNELQLNRDDIARTIWHQLNQLPDISLDTFEYNSYTNAKAWLQLVRITRLYTGEPSVLQSQLKQWYDLHPNHAAMNILPDSFQRSLSVVPFKPQKVAVLLPFTGKLRKQAGAIRNGLLVANQDHNDLELMFIDSELPIATIEQKLQAQQVEFIVGPLHKDKVELFAQSPVISQLPTLFLNRINQTQNLNDRHFYFGLTPEDEAEQAAIALFKKGYKKPSIIAPNNTLGKRLSEKFQQTWLSQRSEDNIMTPEVSFYSNQAQMQQAVKGLMDVDLSKKRISRIKLLVNPHLKTNQLFTEARNRKDLDVVYIIGNIVQTRMLKPSIDVNVSPFSTPIPVYATSRSHTVKPKDSDKRDLRALTFTEIPWLLKSETRYDKQRAQFNQIWPTVDASLRRLFALGYDALTLIERIAQLRVLNGLTEQGMSGLLSIDENGNIQRKHLWAKYNNRGEVEQIELD